MYLVCIITVDDVNLHPQTILCLCADRCKSGSAIMVYRPMEGAVIHGICKLLAMRQASVTEATESFLHVITTRLHKASGTANLLRQEVCQLKACKGADISQAWQQMLSVKTRQWCPSCRVRVIARGRAFLRSLLVGCKLCIRQNTTQSEHW